MKPHSRKLWISALGAGALIGSAQAGVVLLDNFTATDGTTLGAHAVDTTTTDTAWSGNGTAAPIVSNAIKLSGNGQNPYIGFTALGAGETLTLTFETLAGTGFGTSNGQGFELALELADGTNVFGIGDHRIDYRGADATGPGIYSSGVWMITDNFQNRSTDAAYLNPTQVSGSAAATVLGTFNYIYDTGAWTISLLNTDTSTEFWSTDGTVDTLGGLKYAPATQAISRISMSRENARAANLDWVQVDISPVPEPSAVALLLGTCSLLIGCRRR